MATEPQRTQEKGLRVVGLSSLQMNRGSEDPRAEGRPQASVCLPTPLPTRRL